MRTIHWINFAFLGISLAATASAQGGTGVSGPHANEEFCKTMAKQVDMVTQFVKMDNPNAAQRAKYFTDAKALNAMVVKTAPSSLAADAALQTKLSNAMFDAQISGDVARIRAAGKELASSENLAASKRMSEYCGARMGAPK